jgi:hypothetical protein
MLVIDFLVRARHYPERLVLNLYEVYARFEVNYCLHLQGRYASQARIRRQGKGYAFSFFMGA